MPELSGPIQPIELASWLWLIPFFPLLGALTNALYGSGLVAKAIEIVVGGRTEDEGQGAPVAAPAATVARIAVGSLALSAVASIAYCWVLLELPDSDRFLLRHLWQLVRVGPFDVGVDLVLDPLSAVLALLVTVLGTVVAAYAASGTDAGGDGQWRFHAWLGAFVFFMLVLVLADNAVLLLVGWQGVALAGHGLIDLDVDRAGSPQRSGLSAGTRAFVVQRAADVGIVVGLALLFWGLGGIWDRYGEYQPEISPRLAAVAVTGENAPSPRNDPGYSGESSLKGTGYLTVAALPDSLVYMDDSHSPILDSAGLPLRTPFRRFAVPGGAHSFRVAPDDGFRSAGHDSKVPFVLQGGVLTNYAIPRTGFGRDHEVAFAVLGPTLRFREIRDQLVLVSPSGSHPGRDGVGARRLGGIVVGDVHLVTVACLLILLGAFAKSAQAPFQGWLAGSKGAAAGVTPSVAAMLQGAGMVIAGVYLVARLEFVFTLSHTASLVLAGVGIATALYGALASIFQFDLARVLAYGSASQVGLAYVALGAGAGTAAIFQVTTHAIVKTCLLLSAGAMVQAVRSRSADSVAGSDLRSLGGLAATMPRTARAYRIGCLALTAVPIPLLAGFWSGGAVMEQTFTTNALPLPVARGVYGLLLVTAALTSFGAWRSYYLAFAGKPRSGEPLAARKRLAETPVMTLRLLALLALLASVSGVVLGVSPRDFGGVGDSMLEGWLAPVFSTVTARFDALSSGPRFGLLALGLVVAYAGWALARTRYGDRRRDDWVSREVSLPGLGASAR